VALVTTQSLNRIMLLADIMGVIGVNVIATTVTVGPRVKST
jgi:hypothetical protein